MDRRSFPRGPLAGDRSGLLLAVIFAALIASFLATTLVTQRSSREVESLAASLVERSTVSIDRLASLRAACIETELALARYIGDEGSPAARARLENQVAEARERLREQVHDYLALADEHSEASLRVARSWSRFDGAVERTQDLAETRGEGAAAAAFTDHVEPAAVEVVAASISAIEGHAANVRGIGARIERAHERTIHISTVLTAACVFFAAGGGILIQRQAKQRRLLVEENARTLSARADELEHFAGRVAHDIRNPIAAAMNAAELIAARADDELTRRSADRITRILGRVDAITTGLLDFARSGARPDPGARTEPAEVLDEMRAGIAPEVERLGIDFRIEHVPPVLVACSDGVYSSLAGNLVRNAIKHMGERSERRITVRVVERGPVVRTEVGDTGPGIDASALPLLFEPYFRLHRGPEGLGLGLATVKKLAESHGGAVGVRSSPGQGSTFWFDLPRAGGAQEHHADAPPSAHLPH